MQEQSRVRARLKELGVTLPQVPEAKGNYIVFKRVDNMVYLSGQGPLDGDTPVFTGRVGAEVTVEQGQLACEMTAKTILAVLEQAAGSLDKVEIVKVLGFIASAPDFYSQPAVLNGASDFFVKVLGERGKHARSAVAMPQLPFNCPVEIEVIAKVHEEPLVEFL